MNTTSRYHATNVYSSCYDDYYFEQNFFDEEIDIDSLYEEESDTNSDVILETKIEEPTQEITSIENNGCLR